MHEPPPAETAHPAGLGRRLLAWLLDSLLLLLLLCGLLTAGCSWLAISIDQDLQRLPAALLTTLGWLLLAPFFQAMAYATIWHAHGGQTVGKMLLGLRVVAEDGSTLTLAAAFLRWVGQLISLLTLGLGFWWALTDPARRTWHDRLAGSRVVLTRNPLT